MLSAVVAFKKHFYDRGWAKYDLAKPGSFRLIPDEHVMIGLRKDYADMQQMIFGDYPNFDDVIDTLSQLELEINGLGR
jgi:hypothetical protein